MATPHIKANKGDFAKVVLMPGDPNRAKWIADTFLHDVKLVNEVRGILGFTGFTKNNKRISVMASGMGMPSIGIYSHELYAEFDVDTIIRVGTCGAYLDEINLRDVLIASTVSTDSNWAGQLGLVGTYSAGADFELTKTAYDITKEHNYPLHVGNVLSSDIFYDYDKENWKKWQKLGIMAVEMESYALYMNAALLKKRALCMLTVTDHFTKPEKLTSDERQTGLYKMVEVAIEVAEKFAE